MQPVLVGALLADKYRVDRVVGEGGMGVVLAATHVELEERVAIKLLRGDAANRAEYVARFLREAKASARIRSEHVVRVRDVGRLEDASPYMVMELLDGEDLGELLAKHGPLPVRVAVDHVLQACEAIAEAHALGIVHRDLKPSNLFLTHRRNGAPCVKVLDFGISKLLDKDQLQTTSTRDVFGSPLYMSPEQLRASADVDGRADVWSMAVVLFELLTGRTPFYSESLAELHVAILQDAAPDIRTRRPDVPEPVASAIAAALVKDRDQRTPSIAAFAAALAPFASPVGREAFDWLNTTSKLAPPVATRIAERGSSPVFGIATQGTFTSSPRGPEKNKLALAFAVCALLGVIGVVAIASSIMARPQPTTAATATAAEDGTPAVASASDPVEAPDSGAPERAAEPAPAETAAPDDPPVASAQPTAPPPRPVPKPQPTRPSTRGKTPLPDDRR